MKLLPGILRARGFRVTRCGARYRVHGVYNGEQTAFGLLRMVRSGARREVR